MLYAENIFGGMHLLWWFVWLALLFWIFAMPYDVPGQRRRTESPFNILHKRFAAGEISKEEYLERLQILEKTMGLKQVKK